MVEYLKSGCIAIVPDEGGTPEIVASPELAYRTDEDAAQILARLITDDAFRQEQLRHCGERAKFFSRETYFKRQKELVEHMLDQA